MTRGKDIVRGRTGVEGTREGVWNVPDVDIYETDDGVVLLADMPGVGSEDVEVTVEEGELVIEGRPRPAGIKGARTIHEEFAPDLFRRAFTLSRDVDSTKVEGAISNGVLTVKLPRAEETKTRRIEIKDE